MALYGVKTWPGRCGGDDGARVRHSASVLRHLLSCAFHAGYMPDGRPSPPHPCARSSRCRPCAARHSPPFNYVNRALSPRLLPKAPCEAIRAFVACLPDTTTTRMYRGREEYGRKDQCWAGWPGCGALPADGPVGRTCVAGPPWSGATDAHCQPCVAGPAGVAAVAAPPGPASSLYDGRWTREGVPAAAAWTAYTGSMDALGASPH
jgi:hypothetical protein